MIRSVVFKGTPSFRHCKSGGGSPAASQWRTAFCVWATLTDLLGIVLNRGRSGEDKHLD